MSRYTTEVRWICETNSGYSVEDIKEGKYTPDQIIKASRTKVINFSYPLYDEDHREDLECKILRHYYTREIGAETIGLWQLWFNDRMNLITPKYNELYRLEKIAFDKLLNNIDVTIETDRNSDFAHVDNGWTKNDNVRESSSEQKIADIETTDTSAFSDTPQGGISNVENNSYLTNYTKNTGLVHHTDEDTDHNKTTDNGSGSFNTDKTGQDNSSERTHESGYRGSKAYYEMLADYNEKVLNIDEMIINELRDLFMLIW